MKRLAVAVLLSLASASAAAPQATARPTAPDAARAPAPRPAVHAAIAAARHTFTFSPTDFLLDGKPYQMGSGEMHPARIPAEYWRHRIQMTRAMGLNTIAAYIFWNYHETSEGRFNFATGNRDIARFIRIAQEEGMWVILRPGPYICAERDFGGLPPYLLQDPNLRIRSMYPRYIAAAERYMARLAGVVRPLLVTRGGPILMVQVENEYASYGNDRRYMQHLRDTWATLGIDVPFFTADGPTQYMLEAGSVAGAAVGLDSGSDEKHCDLARSNCPRRAGLLVGNVSRLAQTLGRTMGRALGGRPEEGSGLPPDGEEVVQLLRRARRHQLRLHRGRQLGRQGVRTRPDELRLRRAH